jgi:hypothetical protein
VKRFVVCHNPAEAEGDKAERDAQLACLEAELERIERSRNRICVEMRQLVNRGLGADGASLGCRRSLQCVSGTVCRVPSGPSRDCCGRCRRGAGVGAGRARRQDRGQDDRRADAARVARVRLRGRIPDGRNGQDRRDDDRVVPR